MSAVVCQFAGKQIKIIKNQHPTRTFFINIYISELKKVSTINSNNNIKEMNMNNNNNINYDNIDYGINNYNANDGDHLTAEEVQHLLSKYAEHELIKEILNESETVEDIERKCFTQTKRLEKIEQETIRQHAKECDNLEHLHEKIQSIDLLLLGMENTLTKFQADLGKITGEISSIQSSSSTNTDRLQECKEIELILGEYVEKLTIAPDLIAKILSTEVQDKNGQDFIECTAKLSEKLLFKQQVKRRGGEDATYAAFTDIESELERLRIKCLQKIRDFFIQKFHSLRKPKTNIQLLQTNVLKKYKPLIDFLEVHAADVFREIRALYVETMGKVLKTALQNYISALSVLKLEQQQQQQQYSGGGLKKNSNTNKLIGDVDNNAFGGGGGGAKNHFLSSLGSSNYNSNNNNSNGGESNKTTSFFALGKRASILANIETTAPIIAHSNSGTKLHWEALFRSLQKLLVDMATFEYLFCIDFWKGDSQIFFDVFAQPLQIMDEYVQSMISSNNFDAIGLALVILINRGHQQLMQKRRIPSLESHLDKVNIMLWPRFKMVFDAHIKSVVSACENAKNQTKLFADDVSAHYVTRRYAEFTASMMVLSKLEGGDTQLRNNLDRLRKAQYDLLCKLGERFATTKRRSCFLLNNYDLIHQILSTDENLEHELGFFDEQLIIETDAFVQIELETHFGDSLLLIEKENDFEKALQIFRNFSENWKEQIAKINSEVVSLFSNYSRGMDILQRTLSSLLVKYTDACEKTSASGEEAKKTIDLIRVTNAAFLFECKRYARAK